MRKTESLYHGYRFRAGIISCAVRWYYRLNLGQRDIEDAARARRDRHVRIVTPLVRPVLRAVRPSGESDTAYIVGFYNTERLNSVLGNLPPAVFERKTAAREPIVVSEIT